LARCVEKLPDVAIEVGEGAFEIGEAGWLLADSDFLVSDLVFGKPLGGFAAGVAGFEGVDADHAKTLDLEMRERNRDF